MPWDELKPRNWPAFEKDLDGISRQTMRDHFKLYEGYAKKANECRRILNEFEYDEFGHLGGEGGEPNGAFAELVDREFNGGLQEWKRAVRKAASAARGWVIVGYDLNDGSIFNYIMDTQNLWAVYDMVAVLAIDVYEHAYVRDYGATPDGRKEYVEAFFCNIDWDHVNRQLAQAEAAKECADRSGAQEPAHV
jgi:superoxide dismutase, Fe-Mn family